MTKRFGRRWKHSKSCGTNAEEYRTISRKNSFQSRLLKFRRKRKTQPLSDSWDEKSAESYKKGPLETPIGDFQKPKIGIGTVVNLETIAEQDRNEHQCSTFDIVDQQAGSENTSLLQSENFGFERFKCGCYGA
mmetsp:Transcript_18906/g.27987  ORF Transcript_18906/g.27987 Transcript_18906/m.27987 type:complete len:133 (+) Transcript_18906:168-566(+)